ncbi:uncharacterized protein BXZ73DRAFT_106165 [Epithele typhae]|uniref:uncharacterized protein n=1 Tax=Epithele typhae TaxID=378194 RepID=UPI002007C1EB|nr:uncharacterized protein BXZ73DRAFT_106165 [Epithele typhae]KAH9915436.1 hypothetical protein BXZ73DRAFT_106165 [Epithele typhae]
MSLPLGSLDGLLHKYKVGFGAWLLGTILSTLLEGMLLQQTIGYFRHYSSDPLYLKIWVIAVVVLQSFTVVAEIDVCFWTLITNAFNFGLLNARDPWSAAIVPVVGSLCNLLSESFFARRVWILGSRRHRGVVLAAMAMNVAACGCYFAVSVKAFQEPSILNAPNAGGFLNTAGSALMMAADAMLTSSLIYILYKQRIEGSRRTNSMIDLIVLYVIGSGFLISVFNVVGMILSITSLDNIIFAASMLVGQQIYSNSFLVALNTRSIIRSRGEARKTELDASHMLVPAAGDGEKKAAPNGNPLGSMVFRHGPSDTQVANDEWTVTRLSMVPAGESDSQIAQDERREDSSGSGTV